MRLADGENAVILGRNHLLDWRIIYSENNVGKLQALERGCIEDKLMNRINAWLNLARWAPSAANDQPWTVEADDRGDAIILLLKVESNSETHNDPLDPAGICPIMALGGLAENLCQIAKQEGFYLSERPIFHNENPAQFKILLVFRRRQNRKEDEKPSTKLNVSIESQLKDRRTHRGPLQGSSIPRKLQKDMFALNFEGHQLTVFKKNKLNLFYQLSPIERLRFSNKHLFTSLLSEIQFSHGDSLVGLQPHSLGIAPWEVQFLYLCKIHPLFGSLARNAFSTIMSYISLGKGLFHCDRILMISSKKDSLEGWLELGQTLQRIWLYLSSNQIGVQPLGIPILAYGCLKGLNLIGLTARQLEDIRSSQKRLFDQYGVDLGQPCIAIRIGFPLSTPPQSARKELQAKVIESIDSATIDELFLQKSFERIEHLHLARSQ